MCPGMRPATGWMANFTSMPRLISDFRELLDLVLRLRHGHAVAGDDHHAFRVGHHDTGIGGIDRFHAAGDIARRCLADVSPKALNSTLPMERFMAFAISWVSSVPAEPTTVPAMIMAALLSTKPSRATASPVSALNNEMTTGMSAPPMGSVIMTPIGQREREEQQHHAAGQLTLHNQPHAGADGSQQQCEVDELLSPEAQGLACPALQLGEGDQRTGERDRTDQGTGKARARKVADGKSTPEQFDRRNGAGRAAAHAVVERDHLRHVGHGDPLARPVRQSSAQGDGHGHQQVVLHARVEEGDERGDQHADAGPDDAAACRDRRAHALQAEDEQHGRGEVTDLDDAVHYRAPGLLRLNISSMRSVTTYPPTALPAASMTPRKPMSCSSGECA